MWGRENLSQLSLTSSFFLSLPLVFLSEILSNPAKRARDPQERRKRFIKVRTQDPLKHNHTIH